MLEEFLQVSEALLKRWTYKRNFNSWSLMMVVGRALNHIATKSPTRVQLGWELVVIAYTTHLRLSEVLSCAISYPLTQTPLPSGWKSIKYHYLYHMKKIISQMSKQWTFHIKGHLKNTNRVYLLLEAHDQGSAAQYWGTLRHLVAWWTFAQSRCDVQMNVPFSWIGKLDSFSTQIDRWKVLHSQYRNLIGSYIFGCINITRLSLF